MSQFFPSYLLNVEVWKSIFPVILFPIAVAYSLSFLIPSKRLRRPAGLTILAFSMLGIVTGYIAGLSREPVIHAVLPPVLSLVAGLAIFLVGRGGQSRILVSICVLALAIHLFVGVIWGATQRDAVILARIDLAYQTALAENEHAIKNLREALGLPLEPPAFLSPFSVRGQKSSK